MSRQSRHTVFTGSELTRLLASWAGAGSHVSAHQPASAEQLSQWLAWTDAVALFSALEGSVGASGPHAPAGRAADAAEAARLRAALTNDIVKVNPDHVVREQGHDALGAATGGEVEIDFAPYRRHYLTHQQAMDSAIGALRARLRVTLAEQSTALARLAAVDAVMEQTLVGPTQRLASTVPALLDRRFRQRREAAVPAAAPPDLKRSTPAWLKLFCQDLQAVLLAELDFRFQPIEGLLEALQTTPNQKALRSS